MWWIFVSPALAQVYDTAWPLHTRHAATPEAYFRGLSRPELLDLVGGDSALAALAYEVTEKTAVLYVPEGYAGGAGYGVFLQIDADGEADLPNSWQDTLAEQKMIFVSPHDVGNSQDSALRIAFALDALASVRADYDVDPARLVVGGFSGGGAIATMVGAHWPDLFTGTLDQCRAVMWEDHEIATLPGFAFGRGEIDHLDPDGLSDLQNGPRFAFVSGDADVLMTGGDPFSNYEGIMDGLDDWYARDIRARVFDVPGQAHAKPMAGSFGAALAWTLDCTDDGNYLPRFGTDHMPPHTPFLEPTTPAPAACDPDDPGAAPTDPATEESRGCGCDTPAGAGLGAWVVAIAAALRRRTEPAEPATG